VDLFAEAHTLIGYKYEARALCDLVSYNFEAPNLIMHTTMHAHLFRCLCSHRGVGESGMGYLQGEHGFQSLSHKRAVVYRDTFLSRMTKIPGELPDNIYDIVVKMNVTGFVSEAKMAAAKAVVVGGVAIMGAVAFNRSFL
jgi:hypothetical protein